MYSADVLRRLNAKLLPYGGLMSDAVLKWSPLELGYLGNVLSHVVEVFTDPDDLPPLNERVICQIEDDIENGVDERWQLPAAEVLEKLCGLCADCLDALLFEAGRWHLHTEPCGGVEA